MPYAQRFKVQLKLPDRIRSFLVAAVSTEGVVYPLIK